MIHKLSSRLRWQLTVDLAHPGNDVALVSRFSNKPVTANNAHKYSGPVSQRAGLGAPRPCLTLS